MKLRHDRQGIETSLAMVVWLSLLPAVPITLLLVTFKQTFWPAVLAYHAMCISIPLIYRISLKDAGLVRSEMKSWLPLAIVLSLLLLMSGEAVRHLLHLQAILPAGWEQLIHRTHPRWAYIVYTLIFNALCEEIYWRGFLLPGTGIVWGSIFFWFVHFAAGLVLLKPFDAVRFTLPVLVAALVWGWMRRRYETLWPCILTHFAANAAIFWVTSSLGV